VEAVFIFCVFVGLIFIVGNFVIEWRTGSLSKSKHGFQSDGPDLEEERRLRNRAISWGCSAGMVRHIEQMEERIAQLERNHDQ
jgi:hypothetical protein